jgi:hypothetical protein
MNGPSDYASVNPKEPAVIELYKIESAIPIEEAKLGLVVDLVSAITTYAGSMPRGFSDKGRGRWLLREIIWRAIANHRGSGGSVSDVVQSVVSSTKCAQPISYTHDFVWHRVAGVDYTVYLLVEEITRADKLDAISTLAALTAALNDINSKVGELINKMRGGVSASTLARKIMNMRKSISLGVYTGELSPATALATHSRLSKCRSSIEKALGAYVEYSNYMVRKALGNAEVVNYIELLSNEFWSSSRTPMLTLPIIAMFIEHDLP